MMSPGMHPVLAALQVIDAGLDELAEGNLWSLLDAEALEVRVELERISSRLYAQRLRSTREVETRGAAVAAGASSSRDWLINRVRLHPGEATREVLLAAQVDEDLPATAAALGAGEITPAAVAVIADTDAELRKFATAAQRADAEAALAEHARTCRCATCSTPRCTWPTAWTPTKATGSPRKRRRRSRGGSSGCTRTPTGPLARTATWTRKPPRSCAPPWTRWPNRDPPPTGSRPPHPGPADG